MENEIWKSIPDYEGLYEVSNLGRVRSLGKYYTETFNGIQKTMYSPPKMLSCHYDSDGYLRVSLCKDRKVKCYPLHRLIAFAFIPKIEGKEQINHINGVKDDNRIENLEWCTPKENTIHAHRTGLCGINGKSKQVAKLNEQGEILEVYESARQASIDCGLSGVNSNITKVCRQGYGHCAGFRWKWITLEEFHSFKSNCGGCGCMA